MGLTKVTKGVIEPFENYDVNNINATGIVTATSFDGIVQSSSLTGALPALDGSALTGVVGAGSGIVVENSGTPVGTAGTVNFDSNLNVSFGAGTATVTVGDTDFSITDKIVHTGDTNTAIRFPADDTVTIETSGEERLRVDSNGDVGIGTNAPAGPLHVRNNDNSPGGAIQVWTADTGTNVRSATLVAPEIDDPNAPFTFSTGNSWNFRVDATDALTIDYNGNVGIGTDSPAGNLYVSSTGTTRFFIEGLNGRSEIRTNNGTLSFFANQDSNPSGNNNTIFYRNGANESMRIDSSGNVGIGTDNPGQLLDLQSSDPRINITDTDAGGIFQIRNTSGAGYLTTLGAHPLLFYTNGSESMRINSSGDVGIGTNNPTANLHVRGGSPSEFKGIRAQNDNGLTGLAGIEFSSDSTYAKAAIAQKRSSLNGRGDLAFYVDSSDDASDWSVSDEKLRITQDGNVGIGTDNPAVALDVNGEIRASTGVLFGTDTAAANTLDDYEEGTWTPAYIGSTSNPTVTYTAQEGSYTKIGDMVTVRAKLQVNTTSGGSGNLRIGGLPFTAADPHGGSLGFFNTWTGAQRPAFCAANDTFVALYREATSQSTSMTTAHLVSNCNLTVTVTYKVA